ncbi:MAG: SCO family protein [Acidimicrobiales bacterium]
MALLVVLAVAVGGWVARVALPRILAPDRLAGTAFPHPEPAPSLAGLRTVDGEAVDLADHRGQVVLLFFGYRSCPDICPVTLAKVARAIDQLGGDADRVQVYMVTVDPARDRPQGLQDYVEHFDPRFVGLTGSDQATAEAAARYGIFYDAHEPAADGSYAVDHTASITGIDATGRLKVVWSFDTTVDNLVHDIRALQ